MLKGAEGQPSFAGLQITHFEETRDREVSLDRLGASGIDKKVCKYLLPRAEAASQKFQKPKRFDGWVFVPAKELANARKDPKLEVFASPVSNPDPDDNIYHAHVMRPEGLSTHMMALHLRFIFGSGRIERSKAPETGWLARFWANPTIQWLVARLSRQN